MCPPVSSDPTINVMRTTPMMTVRNLFIASSVCDRPRAAPDAYEWARRGFGFTADAGVPGNTEFISGMIRP